MTRIEFGPDPNGLPIIFDFMECMHEVLDFLKDQGCEIIPVRKNEYRSSEVFDITGDIQHVKQLLEEAPLTLPGCTKTVKEEDIHTIKEGITPGVVISLTVPERQKNR